MLRVKSPSKRDIDELESLIVDEPIEDPIVSALAVQESLDDLSRAVSKEHAHEMLFMGTESYTDSELMRIAASIHSYGTDLNQLGLEDYPSLVSSTEGKLSDFADYVTEKVKKFILAIREFFNKLLNNNEKRNEKMKKVGELDSNAKIEDDSAIMVDPTYVDPQLKTHTQIANILNDLSKFLLTDMFKITNTMETYSVDIHRKLQEKFEFKDISELLDSSADLIYSVKVGLIAIIDGTAKSGKAELNGRNTFMLKVGEYLEYHFDFGDVANYEKLKYTDDKVKQALQLNMTVKDLHPEKVKLEPLSMTNCKRASDQVLRSSLMLDNLKKEYDPHLKSFEGMFKYNRAEVIGRLKDAKKEALAKKVMHSSEQMILTCMKLYSILTVRIMGELNKSCELNSQYIDKSVEAHGIDL